MADIQRAIVIKVDGTEEEKRPRKGRKFSLEELQEFVGGYIEKINGCRYEGKVVKQAYCNEDGKVKGLPVNVKASGVYGRPNDFIVGNLVLVFPR